MVVAAEAAHFQMVAGAESACHGATLSETDPLAPELSYSVVRCRPASVLRRDGADVFLILDQRVRLDELLRHKIRVVEETGSYFVSARNLIIE